MSDRSRLNWKVPDVRTVNVNLMANPGITASQYEVRIALDSAGTGLYFSNYSHDCIPTLRGLTATSWMAPAALPSSIKLVRCGVGEENNRGIELWYRIASPRGSEEFISVTGGLVQALHWKSRRADYNVVTGALPGILPNELAGGDYPDPRIAKTENDAARDLPIAARRAAKEWNDAIPDWDVIGRGNKVIVQGYWYNPDAGSRDRCEAHGVTGDRLACADGNYFTSTAHYASIRVWIKYPPGGFTSDGEMTGWTNSRALANAKPYLFYYLPFVMLHEFGHTTGVVHNRPGNVMANGYPNPAFGFPTPTPEDELIIGVVTWPHTHGYQTE